MVIRGSLCLEAECQRVKGGKLFSLTVFILQARCFFALLCVCSSRLQQQELQLFMYFRFVVVFVYVVAELFHYREQALEKPLMLLNIWCHVSVH